MRTAKLHFTAFLIVLFGQTFVFAQESGPQPAPPTPQSSATPAPSASNDADKPIVITITDPVKFETTSTGGGEGSWSGWLTFFGVVLTAVVSAGLGFLTARSEERGRSLTKQLAEEEQRVRLTIAELELEEKKRQSNITDWLRREEIDTNKSIEERRIDIELKRLGFSDSDSYLAVTRFVHDRQMAEAELLRSFSERLLSESERERSFALFVLSAYVDPVIIERLAAGGEEVVSTRSLEGLSRIDGDEISRVAKAILEQRKKNPAPKRRRRASSKQDVQISS
jgi:hypothetical protein